MDNQILLFIIPRLIIFDVFPFSRHNKPRGLVGLHIENCELWLLVILNLDSLRMVRPGGAQLHIPVSDVPIRIPTPGRDESCNVSCVSILDSARTA
jgi:hypothetical protein